jgi:hypothetical protein
VSDGLVALAFGRYLFDGHGDFDEFFGLGHGSIHFACPR